ncbi:hypothetical protein PJO11_001649 [Campylobacter coli]|nr:hypothetical protein [Campylobacter coli]EKJ5652941.1 hypothetical protein [Campylobacter coli]EKJ6088808.1 hypothetical protein [Campylobacter coli]
MKTFNCNFEIVESLRKQPKFSFNEKDLCGIDLNNNTCIFSVSGAGYSYVMNFLYQYIRAKDKNTKIAFVSNQDNFVLDYWFKKDENIEYYDYYDFEYEKLLSLYKTKAIVICVFLYDQGLFDYKNYEFTDTAKLIFANSENKIFGFTYKLLKDNILDFNTDNLLRDVSTFKSLNLKNNIEIIEIIKEFTFRFLIESSKTSVLSVFKGKKI